MLKTLKLARYALACVVLCWMLEAPAQQPAAAKVSSASRQQRDSSVSNAPGTTPAAPTDTSAQASPAGHSPAPSAAPVTDAAADQSPVRPTPEGVPIPIHTALSVVVRDQVDSASAHNGQMLRGALAEALRISSKHTLPAGTPVALTLVSVAKAGLIESAGELTVQVVRIGDYATLSEMVTFKGTPGHKDLPDSAPQKGTEAVLAAGTKMDTRVAPIPLVPATR